MIENSEPFVRFGASNLATALRVADITLESTGRLVDLQMKTAKEALEQGMRNVKAISDVKDVQQLVALQSKAAQPNLEKVLEYSRGVYAVAAEAQAQIGRVLRTRIGELGGELVTVVDRAAKSASGSDASTAFRSGAAAAHGAVARPSVDHDRKPVRAKHAAARRKSAKRKVR